MSSVSKTKVARAKEKTHHLQVYARVRPLQACEKNRGPPVVHSTLHEVSVKDRQDNKVLKTFLFDRVFDQDSTQVEVYNHVIKPAIEDILKGYNYTVFAYGQSGSGKTYTITGNRSPDEEISWEDDPQCGLVPRSLAHLFDELRLLQEEFTIRVSFLELFNEDIVDLLSRTGDSSKLRLYEDVSRKGAVLVHGLQEEVLHTRRDIHNILQKCLAVRSSSRSHTVFTATVHIKENSMQGDELVRTAKLCLVDLAASEIASRSTAAADKAAREPATTNRVAAMDKGSRETVASNQSLLMLGRVITALVERAPHVPYRESKLTRLLRDTLSGRSRTSFIGTVSPAAACMDDTLATLEYVHRARNIVIKPELNPKLTKDSLIKEYTEEIERLRRDLEACRTRQGVYLLHADYTKLVTDMSRLNKEISEKLAAIKDMHDQILKKRELCKEIGMQLDVKDAELAQSRSHLREQLSRRDETLYLLERHHGTQESLADQARVLLRIVEETSAHLQVLHNKLERNRWITCENDRKRRELGSEFCRDMRATAEEVVRLVQTSYERITSLKERIDSSVEVDKPVLSSMRNDLRRLAATHEEGIKSVEAVVHEMGRAATALVVEAIATNTDTSRLDALVQEYAQNVLPSLQATCHRLKSCSTKIINRYQSFETKNLEVTSWATSSLKKQQTSLLHKKEQFLKEFANRTAQKQKLRTLIHDLSERQSSSNKELLMVMDGMRGALGVAKAQGADYQSIIAEASRECRQEHEAAATLNQRVTSDFDIQREIDEQLVAEMKTRNVLLVTDLEVAVDQAKAATAEVQADLAATRSNMEHLAAAGAAAWVARREQTDMYVSTLTARLEDGLHEQEDMVLQVCGATGEDARSCAAQAERLQRQESASVGGVVAQLESHCAQVSSICDVLASNFESADEVVSLIVEDYVKDQPTGNTPERKEYEYPRTLAATSPHEKIVAEFRASRKVLHTELEILNSTTEEEEDFPSQDDVSEASSLRTTSGLDVREVSPRSEASSVKAVSGSEPDLTFMSQDKENVPACVVRSVSKLPVKVAGSVKKGNVCKQILSPFN